MRICSNAFTTIFFVLFAAPPLQVRAEPATSPLLTGIVNLPEMKFALLEIDVDARKAQLMLREGQRDGPIEVIEIRPNEGRVKVKTKDEADARWLSLEFATNSASGAPTILLNNAGLDSLLYVYTRCALRSLLQHPRLRRETKFTLNSRAGTADEARNLIEDALGEKLIVTIPDGEKFIMVVPKAEASRVRPNAPKGSSSPTPVVQAPPKAVPENEILPAGVVDLRGAPDAQVVLLYADLIGRKLDQSERFPSSGQPKIFFVSVTPLTRPESTYAIETLLAWRNIKVVPTTDGFVKAVRVEQDQR